MAEAEDLPVYYPRKYPADNRTGLRTPLRLIIGQRNIVAETAIGVSIIGSDNVVGEQAQNIVIQNSSGCVLIGGLKNVSIFNSSGITVTESNVSYNYNFKNNFIRTHIKNFPPLVEVFGRDDIMVLWDSTLANSTVSLLSAISNGGDDMSGYEQTIINTGTSGTITISGQGGQTINGSSSIPLGYGESITLKSNGSNWFIKSLSRIFYKKYVALLTQTGTDNPTTIVLENTIGQIDWTRSSTGVYIGTLTNAFPTDKTVILYGTRNDFVTLTRIRHSINKVPANNTIQISTHDLSNAGAPEGVLTDSFLVSTPIEIRVYL